MLKHKLLSLLIITLVYVLSFGAGGISLYILKDVLPPLLNMFIADSIATIVVYIFNLIFRNASVYDPYWSVQPPLILAGFYFVYRIPFYTSHLLIVIPLILWAIRLTVNWAIGFDNLSWQDWRYRDIKQQYPRYEKLIVFFGIMYMPTCLVFLGVIPLWYILTSPAGSFLLSGLGGIIIVAGTLLELFADREMKRYKADPARSPCISSGIWKYSRHPNYMGEILVWIGIFIAGLQNFHPLSLPGVLLIITLFITISIPMMEKHLLARTPAYRDYQRNVSMLLPLPLGKEPLAPRT
jgi:steroid 5-alpha reductase family enzyme